MDRVFRIKAEGQLPFLAFILLILSIL